MIAVARRAALFAATGVAALGFAPTEGSAAGSAAAVRPLPASVTAIMRRAKYRTSDWNVLVQNGKTGATTYRYGSPLRMMIPGSTSKLFGLSAAWRTLGPDSRITTPVFALGTRAGSELTGNLVLVGHGDLTLGGRARSDGSLDWRPIDHTIANAIPGSQLTPENPLAGIDKLAAQVQASGLRRIVGDVVVDDRLFVPDLAFEQVPRPMMINDDLIDLSVRPGRPGQRATVRFRPAVAPYTLNADVQTGRTGSEARLAFDVDAAGRITISGSVPPGPTVVRTVPIADPPSFARTALIEALARRGIAVTAPAAQANREELLPPRSAGYPVAARVAAYVSEPYAETAKLIAYVSHNLGANETVCLLAVRARRRNCSDGFPSVARFLRRAAVPLSEVSWTGPDGGSEANRTTPRAILKLLRWWLTQPDGARWRSALGQPGISGSEIGDLKRSPARGKIAGKSGLRVQGDQLNLAPIVLGSGYVSYLDRGRGRYDVAAVYVGVARTPDVVDAVHTLTDLVDITAGLWIDGQRAG